jgi:hypothetical protein
MVSSKPLHKKEEIQTPAGDRPNDCECADKLDTAKQVRLFIEGRHIMAKPVLAKLVVQR